MPRESQTGIEPTITIRGKKPTTRQLRELRKAEEKVDQKVRARGLDPDKDYRVVSVSIKPNQNPFKHDELVESLVEESGGIFDGTGTAFESTKQGKRATIREYFFWGPKKLATAIARSLRTRGSKARVGT